MASSKSSKILGEKFDGNKYSFQTLNPSDGPDFPKQRPRTRDNKHNKCGKWALLIQIGVGLLLLGLGIIIGYFSREPEFKVCQDKPIPVALKLNPLPPLNEILNSDAEASHHEHSSLNQIVISGSAEDDVAAQFIYNTFRHLAFDYYEKVNYSALLSLPKEDNVVRIMGKNNVVIYSTGQEEDDLSKLPSKVKRDQMLHTSHSKANKVQLKIQPFVAYSKKGEIQGEVVYVNYGRPEDFDTLSKNNISVINKVALIRLGQLSVYNKLNIAARYKVSAVLLYHDPPSRKAYSGDDSAPFLTLNAAGDPQTPGFPSVDNAMKHSWRVDEQLPLAQTISRQTARFILSRLDLMLAPSEWVGSFNVSYFMGKKDNSEWTAHVIVNNEVQEQLIQSVCGTIQGLSEPDRYVLLGSNRNSFEKQSIEMMSPLLTLAEDLSQLKKANKWVPWRTIKLCSWGGAELGNLGFVEWVEGHRQELFHKAVSYIHLETSSEKLNLAISPGLKSLVVKLRQEIKSLHDPRLNAYKGLMKENSKSIVLFPAKDTSQIIMDNIGLPTISIKGISNLHTNDSSLGHLGTLILLALADVNILPLDMQDYARFISIKIKESCEKYPSYIDNALKEKLLALAEDLLNLTEEKTRNIHHKSVGMSQLEKESLNDELISFGRSFLDQSGSNYRWRYLLSGAEELMGLPTLSEAANNIFENKAAEFHRQISLIIYAMHNAINTLKTSHI